MRCYGLEDDVNGMTVMSPQGLREYYLMVPSREQMQSAQDGVWFMLFRVARAEELLLPPPRASSSSSSSPPLGTNSQQSTQGPTSQTAAAVDNTIPSQPHVAEIERLLARNKGPFNPFDYSAGVMDALLAMKTTTPTKRSKKLL